MTWTKSSPLRFIVFLLVIALLTGYVLWQWSQVEPVAPTETAGPTATGDEPPAPPLPAPPAPDTAGGGFSLFVDGRLERDRSRQQHQESLQQLLARTDLSAEARQAAEMELLELSRLMAQEAELENLLRVRGFADAVTFLYPEAGVIVVKGESLTEPQVAQVADLVVRVAGTPLSSISVMARPE